MRSYLLIFQNLTIVLLLPVVGFPESESQLKAKAWQSQAGGRSLLDQRVEQNELPRCGWRRGREKINGIIRKNTHIRKWFMKITMMIMKAKVILKTIFSRAWAYFSGDCSSLHCELICKKKAQLGVYCLKQIQCYIFHLSTISDFYHNRLIGHDWYYSS